MGIPPASFPLPVLQTAPTGLLAAPERLPASSGPSQAYEPRKRANTFEDDLRRSLNNSPPPAQTSATQLRDNAPPSQSSPSAQTENAPVSKSGQANAPTDSTGQDGHGALTDTSSPSPQQPGTEFPHPLAKQPSPPVASVDLVSANPAPQAVVKLVTDTQPTAGPGTEAPPASTGDARVALTAPRSLAQAFATIFAASPAGEIAPTSETQKEAVSLVPPAGDKANSLVAESSAPLLSILRGIRETASGKNLLNNPKAFEAPKTAEAPKGDGIGPHPEFLANGLEQPFHFQIQSQSGPPDLIRSDLAKYAETKGNNEREDLGGGKESSTSARQEAVTNYVSPGNRAAPSPQAVRPSAESRNVERIADSIIVRSETVVREGRTEFRLHLEPPELGSVQVHLTATERGISARLLVHEQGARLLIQSQLESLRQRLREEGISLRLDVTSNDAGSQGQRQPQPEPLADARTTGRGAGKPARSRERGARLPSSLTVDVVV